MKHLAICTICSLIAGSALGAKPVLDDEAKAVVAKRSETRETRMQWWRDAKFGMFVHWGVYSVPAGTYKGEQIPGIGEWIMHDAKIPVAEYKQFARQFNPQKFNADEWVKVMKDAGMKYIVITAKHHDGFAMYHSDVSEWDIDEASPKFKRDPIDELAKACRKHGIRFGLYYSHCWDWTHPGGGKGRTEGGGWDEAQRGDNKEYFKNVALPQVREILTKFKPDVIWFDTPLGPVDVNETVKCLALQPDVICNGRLDFKNGDLDVGEDYAVQERSVPNHKIEMDWETCGTINGTWGYKSYDTNWKEPERFIRNLVKCAGGGGNYLLNVGPTEEGIIPEGSVKVLREIGKWLNDNGEAIYGTRGGPFDPIYLTWGSCTAKGQKLYLHVTSPPENNLIDLPGLDNKITKAYSFKHPSQICSVTRTFETPVVDISGIEKDPVDTIIVVEMEGKPKTVRVPIRADEDGSICLLPYRAKCERAAIGSHCVADKGFPKAAQARDTDPREQYIRVETIHLGKGPTTSATWKPVLIERPGKYRVALKYYAADNEGDPFYVDVDGQRLTAKTQKKDSMDSSGVTVDMGTVTIDKKNPVRVLVGPGQVDKSKYRQHIMWLYCAVLTPVK